MTRELLQATPSHPQWTWLLLTVAGVLLLAQFGIPLVWRLLLRLAGRTQTHLDKIILRATLTPMKLLAFAIGARIALDPFDLPPALAVWGGRLTLALGVGAVALAADRLVRELISESLRASDFLQSSAGILRILARSVILMLALMVMLDSMEISITPLIASLGVGSLAVALALQPSMQQLFAGLYLVMDRPIRVGDLVRLENGEEGTVEAIGWRTVRIRVLQDNLLVVPNDRMASSILLNYSMPSASAIVQVEGGVAYDSDLEKVERVILEAARQLQTDLPIADPGWQPKLRFEAFADSAINFTLLLQVRRAGDRSDLRSEALKLLHRRLGEEGIEIPFPQRTLHMAPGGAGADAPPS